MTKQGKVKAALGVLFIAAVVVVGAFWARPVSFFRLFSEVQMRLAGAKSRYTKVAGYRVHYYELGPATGSVVVLVHGLGGRHRTGGSSLRTL